MSFYVTVSFVKLWLIIEYALTVVRIFMLKLYVKSFTSSYSPIKGPWVTASAVKALASSEPYMDILIDHAKVPSCKTKASALCPCEGKSQAS